MPTERRQIFAFSGVLDSGEDTTEKSSFALVEHAVRLANSDGETKVCYLPTAVGDSERAIDHVTAKFDELSRVNLTVLRFFPQPNVHDVRAHLLSQHVVFVEGGSVVNLMAVWRAHRLPDILAECWKAGVVLAGASAGSLCWHVGGPTDSYRDALDPFTDGLGLLPFSNGVHDDFPGQPRRTTYRQMISQRRLPAGYATEDGVGIHYRGRELHEAVSIRTGKHAWWVEPYGKDTYRERPIVPRLI